MKRWMAMALAGWWAAGAGAADETIASWLAAYPAKLDAIQTVREKAEFRMDMAIGGVKNQSTVAMEFIYRRPDGLAAKGMYYDLYCLGTNATTYQAMNKEYRRREVGGVSEWVDELQMKRLMLQADKRALLQTDEAGRAAALEDFFMSEDARRLPDEVLDGRKCAVFADQMDTPWGAARSWSKIWLDAETGLLRRFESIPTPEWADAAEDAAGETGAFRALQDVKITYAVTEQRVNEPIADEAFTFVPPEGATEDVATPEEIEAEEIAAEEQVIQKAAGLDRFELSGQAAPDFELRLLDGGTFKMSEQKGKIVVIDFWATWCGPAARGLPEMRKLAEAYAGNPDVAVVGFSTDDAKDLEQIKTMAARGQSGFAIGIGPAEAKKAYKITSIPCVVIVGKDGAVQGRRIGFSLKLAKDLRRAIDALLAGEALESATPYTAEELNNIEAGLTPRGGKMPESSSFRNPTQMNGRAFKLRWSREVQSGEAPRTPHLDLERISTAIPPRTFLRLDGATAVLVDAGTGEVAKRVELPAEMCATNEQGEIPEFVYLRTPSGDSIVGYRETYTVTRTGTRMSFRNRKVELFGKRLPDGEPWRKSQRESDSIRGLFVVPVSAEEDLLVGTTWNEMKVLSPTGDVELAQKLDYQAQATFALDADGKPVLYLLGKKIEMYDVVWPPANEPRTGTPPEPHADMPGGE